MILVLLLLSALQTATPAEEVEEIDAFMAKVLEKHDVNWNLYYSYVFKEREVLEIDNTFQTAPIQGFRREHFWFVRDGYLVRSPVAVNGVELSEEEREREEQKWIESLKKKESRGGVARDNFFNLEFEPGHYYFAGRREFEGRDVVAVEYYPEALFDDEDDEDEEGEDDEIEAKMNKVFLISMLIDPEEHQIVQMTLDNLGFDFLPGRWLVQIDTIEASMTMHQPFGDVWLTRDITAFGKVTTAYGDLAVRYTKTFYDYAIAETSATFRFPPRGEKKQKP